MGLRLIRGNVTTTKKKKGNLTEIGENITSTVSRRGNLSSIGENKTSRTSSGNREREEEQQFSTQHFLQPKEEEVIQLGSKRDDENILEKTEDIPVLGTTLRVLASPKTTVVLAGILAGLVSAGALTGAVTKAATSGLGRSGSLIGRYVNVDVIGKNLGLTVGQRASLAKEIGRRRITEVANTITNPKAAGLMKTILKKTFSGKALAIMGGGASSIFLGKWGQAEAGEPISIIMKDVLREAEKTGDYTLYNEAAAARDELTNLNLWEKILLNTPFISPFIGIPNKIKGVIEAGAIMDELARQNQIQQETGETEDDKWARIDQEREERREQERIDDEKYYAQVQKDLADAKEAARKEDEKYWAGVLANRDKAEAAKRAADEKYWNDVRRMNSEIKETNNKAFEDYSKSNLNFGLL